jgi:hypothetical protein
MTFLVVTLVAVFFALAFLEFAARLSFAKRLHSHHPEIWRAHATPRWLGTREVPSPFFRFLRSPAYREVTDENARVLGRRARGLYRARLVVEVLAVLTAIAAWLALR